MEADTIALKAHIELIIGTDGTVPDSTTNFSWVYYSINKDVTVDLERMIKNGARKYCGL